MKKQILTIFLFIAHGVNAQQPGTVEKNIFGVHAGLLGANVYDEMRLSDKAVIRADISLDASIWGGTMYEKTGFLMVPSLSLEPKYYYNITKRADAGKNTKNNAANYFSLNTRFAPGLFVISNYNNADPIPTISFVPTWGLQKKFWRKLQLRTEFGLWTGHYS